MPGTEHAPSDYDPPDLPPLVAGNEPVPGYRLVRPLGKGGFGEVWQVTVSGGYSQAMKFVTLSGEAVAAELRSLDMLRERKHPSVLPVLGVWQTPWGLAVAMELADCTLLDRLKECQAAGEAGIPGPELLAHLRAAAAGLDYLHASKLQHRDVKPQNLLLVGGVVKVADFGMVRALKESSSRHTSGMSVAYAPPEFFRERVSRHSDQYSLAVAYCELRGGRLPFNGNHASVMFGHLEGEPDLSMLPVAERAVVGRALAKEAGERWSSCEEFAESIGRAMAGQETAAIEPSPITPTLLPTTLSVPTLPPLPTPPRRRWLVLAVFGLIAVAVGVILILLPKVDDKMFVSQATGMRFVRIKAGTFHMGSPDTDTTTNSEEKPQHEVTLTTDFDLGVHEVTRGQFSRFVDDTGYKTEAEASNGADGWSMADRMIIKRKEFNWKNPGFAQTDDHPAVCVSWNDAVRFAEWLSKKDGQKYRLPTEAEWEYSCRGGATSKYHFGDDPRDIARYDNVAHDTAKNQFTVPVGQLEPNSFGLWDMHGNVCEWCVDGKSKYSPDSAIDPKVLAGGSLRVIRGGSWHLPADRCVSAARPGEDSSYQNCHIGFRLVRDPFGK